jgi:hypothetical protein
LKLDQEAAEALMRLAHNKDFQTFGNWLDFVHTTFIQGAIIGVDDQDPAVLRGRAQGLSILKNEMEKAPDVVGRIQKIS